jgi:hypothetical protein
VLLRVHEGFRLAARRDVADEPFAHRQLHLADGRPVEAHRRRERERGTIVARQVDGADVRVEPLRDEVRDVVERLLEVVRARDDAGDVGN